MANLLPLCVGVSRHLLPLLLGGLLGVGGCKDLTGSSGLPAGTPNPAFYNTATGALGMRNAAVFSFEQALPSYIVDAGLLTDELEDQTTGASAGVLLSTTGVSDRLDERILPEGVGNGADNDYTTLQAARGFANQALGALVAYDTAAADQTSAKGLRGELYAFEGYAEIMLADLFCSGVPLSTLDYQKDFTYAPSSTNRQVYLDALAKFDTALTLASASDSVVHLAQVGKGRVYLDLGQYAAAADDVATVPDGFRYQLAAGWNRSTSIPNILSNQATVSDREGINGLPFLSSSDPRTTVDTVANVGTVIPGGTILAVPLTFPAKYAVALNGNGYAPFTLASGIEARLIQAEAALNGVATGQGSWIDQLNVLRATIGLGNIADPGGGNPSAQVDTLFTERAYWLFLTGERQGDLRRLLRQYSQYPAFKSQDQVYPTGPYLAPGTGLYGADVTAPIPSAEAANPLFHGCLDRKP